LASRGFITDFEGRGAEKLDGAPKRVSLARSDNRNQ
jgi:hypothetical protein